jgi:hypothetical protein
LLYNFAFRKKHRCKIKCSRKVHVICSFIDVIWLFFICLSTIYRRCICYVNSLGKKSFGMKCFWSWTWCFFFFRCYHNQSRDSYCQKWRPRAMSSIQSKEFQNEWGGKLQKVQVRLWRKICAREHLGQTYEKFQGGVWREI